MVSNIDLKEQVKIFDLRRLDAVMTSIDQIAQTIRKKQLMDSDYRSDLSTYLSFLEVLWKNLLRPKVHDPKHFDDEFTELVVLKEKDPRKVLSRLRELNDALYVRKEKIPTFNTNVEGDFYSDVSYHGEDIDD